MPRPIPLRLEVRPTAHGACWPHCFGTGGKPANLALAALLLVSPLAFGTTMVWDAVSGTTLATLDSRTTLVNGVAFSPDGRLLATTGNDGLIHLWNVSSGQQLATRSHDGSSFGVGFSPDGRRLASTSVDRTVKLWTVSGDSLAADEPLTLTGHTGAVYRVAWSPDGRWLATASRDGTSRIYSVELENLVALARTRVTRRLTSEECQQYLHQEQCPERL